MYPQLIADFVKREQLPASYIEDARVWFLPLLIEIETRLAAQTSPPIVVGINGAQGSGKSTLAKLLALLLESKGFCVANLSIDDFYLGKAKRLELGQQVHPLLSSRGVPGTHDTQSALRTLQLLLDAGNSDEIILPAFDKASDDCVSSELCSRLRGPVQVIILEGWFIGARPQHAAELETAINDLEATEDADGQWRRFVNQRLAAEYQELFAQLDLLIMLKAPGFEQVLEWRQLQERKLRHSAADNAAEVMNDSQILRFIAHFERLTRHCLDTVAEQADIVFQLDEQHRVSGVRAGSGSESAESGSAGAGSE